MDGVIFIRITCNLAQKNRLIVSFILKGDRTNLVPGQQQQGDASAKVLIASTNAEELPPVSELGKDGLTAMLDVQPDQLTAMLDVQPDQDRLVASMTGPETDKWDVEPEIGTTVTGMNLSTESAKWDVKLSVGTAKLDVEPAAETTGDGGERMAMDLSLEDVELAMDMSLEDVDAAFDDIAPIFLSLPKLLTILASYKLLTHR